jgi:hypothetical protein
MCIDPSEIAEFGGQSLSIVAKILVGWINEDGRKSTRLFGLKK